MSTMGKYCKAYLLKDLRAFKNWTEIKENVRKEEAEGKQTVAPRQLTDDSIVYLQEDYRATDGIYKDENILFENVTPEWIDYCLKELKFKVPNFKSDKTAE